MRLTLVERARKQAKKAARRERVAAREAERATRPSRPPETRVSPCAALPFHECRLSPLLFEDGMGSVIVTRALPKDRLVCAMFLVDMYFLGVKDAFIRRVTGDNYRTMRLPPGGLFPVSPEKACKLVYGAVAYAASLGLSPHPDYAAASEIFAGVDPDRCAETFEFGHKGKPLYIAGPHDGPALQRKIARELRAASATRA